MAIGPEKIKAFSLAVFLLLCLVCDVHSQTLSEYKFDLQIDKTTLEDMVAKINTLIPGRVYCPEEYKRMSVGPFSFVDISLAELLETTLGDRDLDVVFHRNSIAVISSTEDLNTLFTSQYFQTFEDVIKESENESQSEVIIGSIDSISLSGKALINGVVRDSESQEEIIGATISLEDKEGGTATEEDGSYTLSLNSGQYVLVVQYVGYQVLRIPIQVVSSGTLDMLLERSTVLLDEVVVQAKAKDINVQGAQVGVMRISTKDIEKLPSFLGEVDIIKGLLLQPGVSSVGEGSSGFNVRGGSVDQNLIMIDQGMIFNASHALGFFSSFNSDIVSEAILYKGTMPATYGGRVASALDIKVKDGSFDRWHLKGGLGLVSSRVSIDGPITPGKTSILFAGRSTYSNWVLKQVEVPEVKASTVSFYDLNFRLTHRFNEKNNLTISAFNSDDQFSYNDEFGFQYGTTMVQGQYRKVLGEQILSTANVVWSRYGSRQDDLEGLDASIYQTGLQYLKFKENVSYLGDQLQANIGASAIVYTIDGNSIDPTTATSIIVPRNLNDQKGVEWGLYGDFDFKVSPRLSIIGGLRFSMFQYLGPQNTYLYEDSKKPSLEGILEPIRIEDRVVHTYRHLQPRASFKYNITESSSVKGGYGRTAQYINQIYNSETPTPTNFWQLSNQYVVPQLAHNFSLGYFHNFRDNLWITSFELFYRNIDQIFDYRGFADLLVNDHLETELLTGVGRAYGAEVSVNRQVGFLHGWINYTYSRSENQIEGINEGDWYVSNFDKPHDLKLIANLQINKRNSVSFNFTFGTGRPITVPARKYLVQNRVVVLDYSARNAYRVPDYHRLDFSYALAQGFRKSKKFKTSWVFSIYNLYSRRNAYSVFLEQESSGPTKIKRLAVLGSAFPSLTFNFELL